MIYQSRKRTKPEDMIYSIYLYISGLYLRNTSKAMFKFIKRSHTAIIDCWILKYKPRKRLFNKETGIAEYIIDETQIKVGSECIWLWVAIKSVTKNIVAINISKERNMFVASRGFYITLQKTMTNIRFQQTVVLGIHKPAGF